MIPTLTTNQLIRALKIIKESGIVNEPTSIAVEEAIVCAKQCDVVARVLNEDWQIDDKLNNIEKVMFDPQYFE